MVKSAMIVIKSAMIREAVTSNSLGGAGSETWAEFASLLATAYALSQ